MIILLLQRWYVTCTSELSSTWISLEAAAILDALPLESRPHYTAHLEGYPGKYTSLTKRTTLDPRIILRSTINRPDILRHRTT